MTDEWNGKDWFQFSSAAAEVRDLLDVSLGAAERTLRQLCASGEVRAIRCQVDNLGEPTYGEEPTFIAPSEWSAAEVDHQGWVEVSKGDLRYWLRKQGRPKLVVRPLSSMTEEEREEREKLIRQVKEFAKSLRDEWEKEDWFPWHDEQWIKFHHAVKEIEALGHSRGVAERTLRELCGSGDIRSICQVSECCEMPEGPQPVVVPIDPGEWRETGELDLHGKTVDQVTKIEGKLVVRPMVHDLVRVSDKDFRHWLKKQQPAKQATTEPKKQALGKRPRIKAHLAKLFPEGVPDPAHCPRKELIRELLKIDPGLKPLDDGTLKTAIDEYNTDPK